MSNLKNDVHDLELFFTALMSEIKESSDTSDTIDSLSITLGDYFNKNISVRIVETRPSDIYFIMSVVPEDSVVNKIASIVADNKGTLETISALWKKCENWRLEFDSKNFDGRFTSAELTAMTLHEVGHIINTNSIPNRISTTVQFGIVKGAMNDTKKLSSSISKVLIKLPIIKACMFNTYPKQLKEELRADKFAIKMGYATPLLTAFKKTEKYLKRDHSKDIEKYTEFTNSSMKMLKEREKHIIQPVIGKLTNNFSDNIIHEAFDDVVETVDTCKEVYYEFMGIGKKKLEPITQAQIDYIAARVGAMKKNDDKIMLLSYANSKLELCNYYLELLDNPKVAKKFNIPNTLAQLTNFVLQLNRLREKIIDYKLPKGDDFVVFYPSKYQG